MKLLKETINYLMKNSRIANIDVIENHIYYIINDEEKTVGLIQLYNNIPSKVYAYLDILIFKDYRNKGYGTESLKLLNEELIKTKNYKQIIYLTNSRIIESFLINSGFKENKEYLYKDYYYQKEII